MTERSLKISGSIIFWIGLVIVAVVGLIVHRPTADAKPPTRVEAYAVTATDELRAELAGDALAGLLSDPNTIINLTQKFDKLGNSHWDWTIEERKAWLWDMVAIEAVGYADATIEALQRTIGGGE